MKTIRRFNKEVEVRSENAIVTAYYTNKKTFKRDLKIYNELVEDLGDELIEKKDGNILIFTNNSVMDYDITHAYC